MLHQGDAIYDRPPPTVGNVNNQSFQQDLGVVRVYRHHQYFEASISSNRTSSSFTPLPSSSPHTHSLLHSSLTLLAPSSSRSLPLLTSSTFLSPLPSHPSPLSPSPTLSVKLHDATFDQPLKQLVQNANDEALSAFMQISSEHRSFNFFLCCSVLETIAMNLLKKVVVYSWESLPWKIDLLLLFFRRHWLMAKELQIRTLLRTTSFRSSGLLKGSDIEMIKSDSDLRHTILIVATFF